MKYCHWICFTGIRLSGIEAVIVIYDVGKSETEYENIMRCSKNIISQCLPVRITLNMSTTHYHKGEESDKVLLMSDYILKKN